MARYNTVLSSTTVSTSVGTGSPSSGLFTEIPAGASAGITITLATPASYAGTAQTFYNASSNTVTLSTPTGIFTSTASTNFTLSSGDLVVLQNDGTNYIPAVSSGGHVTLTGATITSGQVTNAPANSTDITNKSYVDNATKVSAFGMYYGS
jgi:hypothetical protein